MKNLASAVTLVKNLNGALEGTSGFIGKIMKRAILNADVLKKKFGDVGAAFKNVLNEFGISMANIKSLAGFLLNLFGKIVSIYKDQLLKPMDAITDMMQGITDVDVKGLMAFDKQLSSIASTTKTIISDQIAWQETLISTYKPIAEAAKGSMEIYNAVVQTRGDITENIYEWMQYGTVVEGVNLAVNYLKDIIGGINEISNDVLLNWRKQNLALGISTEHSAKIAGYQKRSGLSLEESLSFQRQIFGVLKQQFKSSNVTSKLIEDIAESNWAILSYSKGNVEETARIAANAHSWKVSIDEIYSTSQKLAEAEKAIELTRKSQLMFGIQLNTRQLQFMAQTGQEVQLAEYLVDTFKDNIGTFDELTLAQRQFIADTIASGDVIKARTMLLGREEQLMNDINDPVSEQVDILKESNELIQAQTDYMAVYNGMLARTRRMLWDSWKNDLGWIFGEYNKINSAEELSLKIEESRYKILRDAFLPIMQRLNWFFNQQNEVTSLIGNGIHDMSSVLGRTYAAVLRPMLDIVSKIGLVILDWWINSGLQKVSDIMSLITDEQIDNFATSIINVAESFGSWLVYMFKTYDVVGWIADIFVGVGNTIMWLIENLPKVIDFLWAIKSISIGIAIAKLVAAVASLLGAGSLTGGLIGAAIGLAAGLAIYGWGKSVLSGLGGGMKSPGVGASSGAYAGLKSSSMPSIGSGSSSNSSVRSINSSSSPGTQSTPKLSSSTNFSRTTSSSSNQNISQSEKDQKLADKIAQAIFDKLTISSKNANVNNIQKVIPVFNTSS